MSEAPLSAFNSAGSLQKYVCEALNCSNDLSSLGITFYPEDAQDIEYMIKNNLSKQGLACVVLTPKSTYQGHDGSDIAWTYEVALQIVEYVPVNRAKNKQKYTTALQLAHFCNDYLGGPQCALPFGTLCPKGIEQGEDDNLLVVRTSFDCTVLGQAPGAFVPQGGSIIISEYVLKNELSNYLSAVTISAATPDKLGGIKATPDYIQLSGDGDIAGLSADFAQSAANSDYANTAGTAGSAGYADSAGNATTADSATNANYASAAGQAEQANNATHADSATNADYAIEASHASVAATLEEGSIEELLASKDTLEYDNPESNSVVGRIMAVEDELSGLADLIRSI